MTPKTVDSRFKRLRGKDIMITGGLGMLGTAVAHQLVKYGADVTLVDACIANHGANRFNIKDIKNRVRVNIADIRDRESMSSLVRNKDIIFNFAGQASHNDSIIDPFLDAEINYIGHLNVLESVKKFNPRAKLFFSGSRLQFGKIEKIPVNESCPLCPETPYAFNKTVSEQMYNYYHKIYGIRCVIFRIANPFGIWCQMKHSKYSIVNYFIRQAMEDKDLTVFGDGNQLRDYIYVEDLARAFIIAAVDDKANGQTFNVGSGIGIRFGDMVKSVTDIIGKGRVKHVPWPDDYLNVETGDYVTDITKISNVLSWQPETHFRQAVEKTFRYYEKYGKYYF